MARETITEKALRYIADGRLFVEHADGRTVTATCHGGAVYRLGFNGNEWTCDCPARRGCAHLAALQLVAARQPQPDAPTRRQLADAQRHAVFHAARLGEPLPLPTPAEEPTYVTVGGGRLVLDHCWRCDTLGPILPDGTCGNCR